MKDPAKLPSFVRRYQNMNMIGHYNPGTEPISLTDEEEDSLLYQVGDFGDFQPGVSAPTIYVSFDPFSSCCFCVFLGQVSEFNSPLIKY